MSKETQDEKPPVLLDVVLNEVKEKGTSKVCRENGESSKKCYFYFRYIRA